MGDQLTIRPQLRATGQVRRASSSCCGAKIDVRPGGPGPAEPDGPDTWSCRGCGQPCLRIMTLAGEVQLRG